MWECDKVIHSNIVGHHKTLSNSQKTLTEGHLLIQPQTFYIYSESVGLTQHEFLVAGRSFDMTVIGGAQQEIPQR